MRNGQNKRMRGRNRNKGHHGGHHHHHNPLTRVYESNGPEVKIRGTAHHIAEKYVQLARDATASGDHVTAENYHQHAEHYFRLIAAAQEQLRQQNPYYQPQQAGPAADNIDGAMDEGDDDDPAQPNMGQPQFPNQQQPQFQQQQPFPPREQPPQYQPQQPQYLGRPQPQQQPQVQQQQQPQPQPQYQQQPQFQPPANFESNEGLPSFITGGQSFQPQAPQQQNAPNGYDNQNGGDRYPRHRRRRHRAAPRPDMPQPDVRDEGPEPGNR